ncbi:hypothetical protein HK405_010257, partial [Cladochytrium tenue]
WLGEPASTVLESGRLTIVCPESYGLFRQPASTAAALLASPRAVATVARCVTGRRAFILPAAVGRATVELAVALGLPLLGPDFEALGELASVRWRRRLIDSFCAPAVVNPPGVRYVRSEAKLADALVELLERARGECVAIYLRSSRNAAVAIWEVHRGRYQSVPAPPHLLTRLRAEAYLLRDGGSRGGILDFLATGLASALTVESVACCRRRQTATCSEFCEYAPVTGVHVCVFPGGEFEVLGTTDSLHLESRRVWGHKVPQTTTHGVALQRAVEPIVSAVHNAGILGYVSIELETTNPLLPPVCVGIRLGYTAAAADAQLAALAASCTVEQGLTGDTTSASAGFGGLCFNATRTRRARLRALAHCAHADRLRAEARAEAAAAAWEMPPPAAAERRAVLLSRGFRHRGLRGVPQASLAGVAAAIPLTFDDKIISELVLRDAREAPDGVLTDAQSLDFDAPPGWDAAREPKRNAWAQKPKMSPTTQELLLEDIESAALARRYPSYEQLRRALAGEAGGEADAAAALAALLAPMLPDRKLDPSRVEPGRLPLAAYLQSMERRVDVDLSRERDQRRREAVELQRAARLAGDTVAADDARRRWLAERALSAGSAADLQQYGGPLRRGLSVAERVEGELRVHRMTSTVSRDHHHHHYHRASSVYAATGNASVYSAAADFEEQQPPSIPRLLHEFMGRYVRDGTGGLRREGVPTAGRSVESVASRRKKAAAAAAAARAADPPSITFHSVGKALFDLQ